MDDRWPWHRIRIADYTITWTASGLLTIRSESAGRHMAEASAVSALPAAFRRIPPAYREQLPDTMLTKL